MTIVCEVCSKGDAIVIASIPGVPISVGYCIKCLEAGAHPYWILVGNTATAISKDKAHQWREAVSDRWQELVDNTLKHLNITEEKFVEDVIVAAQDFENFVASKKAQESAVYN